jgi:2-phosphosulfolactate phosphatase
MSSLRVHSLPESLGAGGQAVGCCVVIDVLRASTTIVYALAAGAREVIPCRTIDEARKLARELPPGSVVLGGERHGLPIEGFDLGNSPAEYTPQVVTGKTVVLTTTNGTQALDRARQAARVFIGAFVNLTALSSKLAGEAPVDLVCAGTDGQPTTEDVLFAGAVAARLSSDSSWQLDPHAESARQAWLELVADPTATSARLLAALGQSRGGQNLLAIGMQHDLALAAEIDRFSLVPSFDTRSGRITTSESRSSSPR